MADMPARVGKLETKVAEHDLVLFGPEKCPDDGLVSQFNKLEEVVIKQMELNSKQTVYNKIMTWVASAVGIAVIGYIMSLILR